MTSILSIPQISDKGYVFLEESIDSLVKDIIPLAIQNYQEMGTHVDKVPLKPNFDGYAALYNAGKLKLFTIRDKDNNLLGYNVFCLFMHMYHMETPMALQDVTYVHPKARGWTSISFLKWCDKKLINLGAKVILYHVKPDKRDFGPILNRMGYSLVDHVYAKWILDDKKDF
jgi:hypothetical protein